MWSVDDFVIASFSPSSCEDIVLLHLGFLAAPAYQFRLDFESESGVFHDDVTAVLEGMWWRDDFVVGSFGTLRGDIVSLTCRLMNNDDVTTTRCPSILR